MGIKFYVTTMFIFFWVAVVALQTSNDSSGIITQKKKNLPQVITRVHTMGLFLYMGKVVNHNPAADIYFNYTTRNGWGIGAFKVVDMNDVHSHNNFAFALVSKTFHFGERMVFTTHVGTALEQQNSFANEGSDVLAMLTTSYRLSKNLVVDHNAMFTNLVFEKSYTDWINRIRVMYSGRHVDVTGLLWHNNGAIDRSRYTTAGASIFYNRVPINNRLWLGAGLTGLVTTHSSNPEQLHGKSGIQFTTSVTFK